MGIIEKIKFLGKELTKVLEEKNVSELDPDKDFVDTRNKIPKYELMYGEFGLFLGLFVLIFVAFRNTFKILKKK